MFAKYSSSVNIHPQIGTIKSVTAQGFEQKRGKRGLGEG